jgi:hypothetical protein
MKKSIMILSLLFALLAITSQIFGVDKNITIILLWMAVILINLRDR